METDSKDEGMAPEGAPSQNAEGREAFWRANKRLIFILLTVWVVVSLGCGVWWVEWLNQFTIGSLPLGFWIAQQGSIYTFVILILIYAVCADRLEREHGVAE
jgi:putative solute:sodium symporter small subunit